MSEGDEFDKDGSVHCSPVLSGGDIGCGNDQIFYRLTKLMNNKSMTRGLESRCRRLFPLSFFMLLYVRMYVCMYVCMTLSASSTLVELTEQEVSV